MKSKTKTLPVFVFVSIVACAFGFLVSGCHRWDSQPGHYLQSSNAMASVSAFIATNGWNTSTNAGDLYLWEELRPPCYISDLPWSKLKGQRFQALTYQGILYVLSNEGWHHDYAGVAYNPLTNHFPDIVDGFRPIGNHWYVWCWLEFPTSGLAIEYE